MIAPDRTVDELREAIRAIAQRGWLLDNGTGLRTNGSRPVIGVTSPNTSEGKTTLALALAGVLADEIDGGVTLIDADFNTHSIGLEYALLGVSGLAEVLAGTTTPSDAVHPVPATKLAIVPAGIDIRGANRHIRSQQAHRVMSDLGENSNLVVVDLPATLDSAAAAPLASMCDAVIMVVRTGRTSVQDVEDAMERLHGANVIGIVLNGWETSIPGWAEQSLGLKR